ncbi:MAG: hypothetical protein LBP85_06860 [Prevotellaceae bacterium]|jgi:hypothetical protein|nr:hypothetical protein [Prevotellaceae bacterium]
MKKKCFLALLAASMFFTGCKDDDNNVPDPVDKNYNVKEFFSNSAGKLVQTFPIKTSELPKTLTLAGGTKITIDDGAFAIGGAPVTGDFTLEVIECVKPSHIVYSGTNTNHISGEILKSDGFIFINAKQGETNVDKNLLKNITVEIKQTDLTRNYTHKWEGIDTAGVGGNQFAWDDFSDDVVVPDPDQPGGIIEEIIAVEGYFPFKLGKLGWFNCDVYWDYGPKKTLFVKITGGPVDFASYQGGTGSTCVFFHGYGDLVVSQLYTPYGTDGVKSYDESMPVGKKGTLLAFSVKEGEFYLAKQEDVTITENLNVTLNMVKSTEKAIQEAIDALDD